MGKNARKKEAIKAGKKDIQLSLEKTTEGTVEVGDDDCLIFENNPIWQLKVAPGSNNGLDHCNYCDVYVPIHPKCLREHFLGHRHRNYETIHNLLPVFEGFGMGWIEDEKRFYCDDCDDVLEAKAKTLVKHITKHTVVERSPAVGDDLDFNDVESIIKVFKQKLWKVDFQSTNAGLNLQLLKYRRISSPFILQEDSPSSSFIGSLKNDVFSKGELDLITRVACFLEAKGDKVNRSEKIQSSNMKAFGMRRAMGDTGWYKHKDTNLYKLTEDFTTFISIRLEKHYPKVFQYLRKIVTMECGTANVTIGDSPFTSFALTKEYNVRPHLDQDDYDIGFILWLQPGAIGVGEESSLFSFPEYEVSFVPAHGDVLCLKAAQVYHCTRLLKKKNQLGIAFFQKSSLFRQVKKLSELPMDGFTTDVVPKKGKTPQKTIYEKKADFELRKSIYAKELAAGTISLSDF